MPLIPRRVAGSESAELKHAEAEESKACAAADPDIVVLDWADLEAGKDLSAEVMRAFGEGGLGLCAVRGVPGMSEARQALLPLSSTLGQLPDETLAKYERPETHYCFGWSRGREKFQGKADLSKGSWYANPIWNDPSDGDKTAQEKFPYAASPNQWPSEVPDLESAFRTMGQLVYDVAQPLVKQCDRLVEAKFPGHGDQLFEKTFAKSRLVLGRLLHYYPGETSWCGWHNDNSTITGLVPALWMDSQTGLEAKSIKSEAGLYVQTRSQSVKRIMVSPDCLLYQIGESAQILSGGVLRATPHCVRGPGNSAGNSEMHLSRESFAVFMEPNWDAQIGPPRGATQEDVLREEEKELIPPISKRWKPDPDTKLVEFGKFLGDSMVEYYRHNNED